MIYVYDYVDHPIRVVNKTYEFATYEYDGVGRVIRLAEDGSISALKQVSEAPVTPIEVRFVEKYFLSAVAPSHHMKEGSREVDSRGARHDDANTANFLVCQA